MYLVPIEQLVLPLACRGMVLKVRHPGMAEIMVQSFTESRALSVKSAQVIG